MTERAKNYIYALKGVASEMDCNVDTTLFNKDHEFGLFQVRVKPDGTVKKISYGSIRRLGRGDNPNIATEQEELSYEIIQKPNIVLAEENPNRSTEAQSTSIEIPPFEMVRQEGVETSAYEIDCLNLTGRLRNLLVRRGVTEIRNLTESFNIGATQGYKGLGAKSRSILKLSLEEFRDRVNGERERLGITAGTAVKIDYPLKINL